MFVQHSVRTIPWFTALRDVLQSDKCDYGACCYLNLTQLTVRFATMIGVAGVVPNLRGINDRSIGWDRHLQVTENGEAVPCVVELRNVDGFATVASVLDMYVLGTHASGREG